MPNIVQIEIDYSTYHDDNSSYEEDIESEDSNIKIPPTDNSIKRLKSRKCTDNENSTSCPICIEKFKTGDDLLEMECGHSFHRNCLMSWLEYEKNCPNCRSELNESMNLKVVLPNNKVVYKKFKDRENVGDLLNSLHDELDKVESKKKLIIKKNKAIKNLNTSLSDIGLNERYEIKIVQKLK